MSTPLHADPDQLERDARATSARGDRAGAVALWTRLLKLRPDHPAALNAVGNWHLAQGDATSALALLARAVAIDPDQPALHFNHAAAARAAGDHPGALTALDRALAIDPYFVQAIFQKAVLLEEMGDRRGAARIYRDFLDTAPPEILTEPRFAEVIARARGIVEEDNAALGKAIAARADAPSPRTREAMAALLGQQPIYIAEPTFFTVPRLPAIPFLDRALTPWIEALEAATPAILAEAGQVMAEDAEAAGFVPYVDNPPGVPANQWAQLDHSPNWSAFFFWKHGARNEAHCARCPQTAALLDRMPLLTLAGRGPNAFFSLLKPRTRIPPHTGVTNSRSTVHLPLVVPDGCGFRVGAETREWVPGTAWAFDDTIEHEAWNDSDHSRLILIFDVWNPYLDEGEIDFISGMLASYDSHYGRAAGVSDTL
jgi:aspartyl/asparaginyl beta-hydroxylase (cupin superfamily)